MIARDRGAAPRRSRSLAQLERDAALDRVGRARRWMIVGAAALTAGFAALVAAIAPGRSAAHTTPLAGARTSVASAAATVTQMPPLATPNQLGLQGPSQAPGPVAPQSSGGGGGSSAPSAPSPAASAPAPAPTPAPAVSGGS